MKRLVRSACIGVLLLGVLAPATSLAHPVKDDVVKFEAKLSGANEVPAVNTQGAGVATIKLVNDRTELRFRLLVKNLTDVVQAHIHLGPAGVNGPVVVFLLHPGEAPPGPFTGLLAEGSATAADLVGPLAGHPFSELVDAMLAGNTYVNVHTVAFPAGEIRGQVVIVDD
ncbi:MAG: CHRD domain-containing protein [Actinobacteria bacterium]|nr:CHRD domain-containing protein [Actinomycetota bacterium]